MSKLLDKFYTKNNIATLCVDKINSLGFIQKDDLVIEPSAGAGAFMVPLRGLSLNCKFYDLKPEHKDIVRQDFLELSLGDETPHFVGNPPFGRQSSLVIRFIKKCCSCAQSISFILPRSFKKASLQRHFSSNFHLVLSNDLPRYSFLLDGSEVDVPCVFQIWIRRDYPREIDITPECPEFDFVPKNNNPDLAICRVGINAGKLYKNVIDCNINTHYFIKLNNPELEYIFSILEFDNDNTVGPRSISKKELIIKFYEKVQKDTKRYEKVRKDTKR